jgi:NifU-like protein involved in Fe-S cluster formation
LSGAERLYTPELLALTLKLADYPLDDGLPLEGAARSKSCGSTLTLRLALDEAGAIARLGLRAHACAVGQASAAIFAEAARGREPAEIERAARAMERWIAQVGPPPDWPGIEMLDPARAYPARHGAMMLPWQAVLAALSTRPATR